MYTYLYHLYISISNLYQIIFSKGIKNFLHFDLVYLMINTKCQKSHSHMQEQIYGQSEKSFNSMNIVL